MSVGPTYDPANPKPFLLHEPVNIEVTVTFDGVRQEEIEGQLVRELHERIRNDWLNHGRAQVVEEVAESLENDDWPVPVPVHAPDYLKPGDAS